MHLRTFVFFMGLLGIISSCQRKAERHAVSKTAKNIEEQPVIRTADTSDINKWLADAEKLDKDYPDSAAVLYKQAIQSSKEINYVQGAAKAYYSLPFVFQYHGDFKQADLWQAEAVLFMKKAIADAQIPQDAKAVRLLYSYLTLLYSRWGDLQQTLAIYKSAQAFFDADDSLQRLQWFQISTEGAGAYIKLGQYDSASAIYYNVLDQLKTVDKSNYFILSSTYNGLGFIKARLEAAPIEETLSWFKKAEQLARQYADTSGILTSLGNIAALCYDKGNYTAAKEHAQEALKLVDQVNNNSNLKLSTQKNSSHTLAASYIKEGRPEEALPYSKMALKSARALHATEEEIDALYVTGYNYLALEENKKAERYFLDGIALARETGQMDNISNAYGQLSVAYFNMGQYKSAYIYRRDYANIRDSLLGKENASRIAEINARYQVAQKDKALAEKDKTLLQNQLKIASQEKRQYLWIGGSVVSILILLGFLYQKKQKAMMNRLKATIAGEEKERGRLARELHDGIVSRLSIIKMNFSALPRQFQYLNDAEAFHEVVGQLEQSIAELRSTSHNLLPDMLQRAGLAISLETYFEQIRKITLLDIEFQTIGELPPLTDEFQLNIYRIIQELVNNMIKHSDAKCGLIQFNIQKDWLTITLDNDGTVPEVSVLQGNGIGLYNLHERIRLLHGSIEMEHDKSTSVYMEFNLKKFISKH